MDYVHSLMTERQYDLSEIHSDNVGEFNGSAAICARVSVIGRGREDGERENGGQQHFGLRGVEYCF